jgi:hypothetical protein
MADSAEVKRVKFLIEYIRTFLRDTPELNRLTAGAEHSDKLIAMAMFDTLERVQSMTPPIPVSSLPINILRIGSTIFLLQSVGLLMTRNQLNYRTGRGTGIGIQDKVPLLMNWIQMFQQEFKETAKEWKVSLNLSRALGGSVLHSEYALINGLYGYWGLG